MISIIIASINPKLLKQVKYNIAKTIGVEYEIIAHDNRKTNYGISKVYNFCAQKAKYDYLVFCHEDILFHTQNWGYELINLLQNKEIGLVGVSGAVYKSQYPTSWASLPFQYYRTNVIRGATHERKSTPNLSNKTFFDVVVIDGLFLSTKQSVFKEYKFNEKDLKGFHLYDIDLSVRIKQKYKVVVSNNILIEHFSDGSLDLAWFNSSIMWHKINSTLLPLSTLALSKKEIKEINIISLRSVTYRCYLTQSNYNLMIKSIIKLLFTAYNIRSTYGYLKLFIVYSLGFRKR